MFCERTYFSNYPRSKRCQVFALLSEWPQLGPFQIRGQRVQVTNLQIIACEEWGPFGFPTLRFHLKSFLFTFSPNRLPSPIIDQGGILGDACENVAPRPADAHLDLLPPQLLLLGAVVSKVGCMRS